MGKKQRRKQGANNQSKTSASEGEDRKSRSQNSNKKVLVIGHDPEHVLNFDLGDRTYRHGTMKIGTSFTVELLKKVRLKCKALTFSSHTSTYDVTGHKLLNNKEWDQLVFGEDGYNKGKFITKTQRTFYRIKTLHPNWNSIGSNEQGNPDDTSSTSGNFITIVCEMWNDFVSSNDKVIEEIKKLNSGGTFILHLSLLVPGASNVKSTANAAKQLLNKAEEMNVPRVVVVTSTQLRMAGASIARRLSWEESIETFFDDAKYFQPLRDILDSAEVIMIRFGVAAVLVVVNRAKSPREAFLVYDPRARDGTVRDLEHDGRVFGTSRYLIANLIKKPQWRSSLSLGQPDEDNIISDLYSVAQCSMACIQAAYDMGYTLPNSDNRNL